MDVSLFSPYSVVGIAMRSVTRANEIHRAGITSWEPHAILKLVR
jgi:hypothetical protein